MKIVKGWGPVNIRQYWGRELLIMFSKVYKRKEDSPLSEIYNLMEDKVDILSAEFHCTEGHMEQVINGLIPKEVHYEIVQEKLCRALADVILKNLNVEVVEYTPESTYYPVTKYKIELPILLEKNVWNQLGD